MPTDFQKNPPKITLVTACLNADRYLEDALLSVLNQGYPNLEFMIFDGGSTDETKQILKRYEGELTAVYSGRDKGMYDAINKGFQSSSGSIMGWLNADDLLHHRSLFTVAEIFEAFDDVHWITGIPTNIDEQGRFHASALEKYWTMERLISGRFGTIQQESTFWRRSLWNSAGGSFNPEYSLAADFELWCRFFRLTDLVTVQSYIGGFRKHSGSLSVTRSEEYDNQIDKLRKHYRRPFRDGIRRFRGKKSRVRQVVYNPEKSEFRQSYVFL